MKRLAVLIGLVVGLTLVSAPAEADMRIGGRQQAQSVSYRVGTHLYVRFNRSESRKIMLGTSDAYAVSVVAASCYAFVPAGPIGIAGCAAASGIAVRVAHEITTAAFNSHNWCLTEKVQYLPFTSRSTAYWRNCRTGKRVS